MTRTASKELPPSAKKLSSTSNWSVCSTSPQMVSRMSRVGRSETVVSVVTGSLSISCRACGLPGRNGGGAERVRCHQRHEQSEERLKSLAHVGVRDEVGHPLTQEHAD